MGSYHSTLLTIDEVSSFLKVSRKTVYYWVSRAEIPFIRVGRHLRFDRESIVQHFNERTQTEDRVLACVDAKGPLKSGPRAWSLRTRTGLAGS